MNTFNQQLQPGATMPQRNYFNSMFNNNPTATNNIIWVQGIEGAKAWQLNPNSMVILLDSEDEGKMYIKVSDNIGMSSLRVFNYEETDVNKHNNNVATNATINNDLDLSQFVRKDELSSLIKEILDEQSIQTTGESSVDKPKVITVLKK